MSYFIVIDYGDSEDTFAVEGDTPRIGETIHVLAGDAGDQFLYRLRVESIRHDVARAAQGKPYRCSGPLVFCIDTEVEKVIAEQKAKA